MSGETSDIFFGSQDLTHLEVPLLFSARGTSSPSCTLEIQVGTIARLIPAVFVPDRRRTQPKGQASARRMTPFHRKTKTKRRRLLLATKRSRENGVLVIAAQGNKLPNWLASIAWSKVGQYIDRQKNPNFPILVEA